MPIDPGQAKAIFLAAIEKDGPERATYLESACAADSALRQRVEAMLHAHEASGELLQRPPADMLTDDGVEPSATAAFAADPAAPPTEGAEVNPDDALAFLAPPARAGSIGRLGHYHVQEVVGKGGFGIVLKAFDEKLHRIVAIKVMAPELAANAAARKRFIREARAAAAVTHEHIVAIHAIEEEHRPPYIVMQYIDGVSLQDKLNKSGPLELREILRIGLQIASGLAAAQKQGLVHRDIKPANILLENGIERVKITDFGLARTADDASVSQSGTVAGTPMYMSPEQANGEHVDHRSDLFSLGTVLYAMCTGRPPFRASSSMAVLKRVCEDTPTPVQQVNPEIPTWLADIIAKLHAKKPEARFQTAGEVAELLGEHLAHLQQPSRVPARASTTVPAVPTARRRTRSRREIVLPIAAGVLMVAIVLTVRFWPRGEKEVAPVTPQPPVAAVAVADKDGWVQLFNGKDLGGWGAPADARAFRVEDGLLVARGNARLSSDRADYADFHFRVEAKVEAGARGFQAIRADRDSQIGYRAGLWPKNPDEKWQCGSLWADQDPRTGPWWTLHHVTEKVVEPDTWFTQEVIAKGSHIEVKINGKTVVDKVDAAVIPGHVAVARGHVCVDATNTPPDYTHAIRFKKIEIKELPPAGPRLVEVRRFPGHVGNTVVACSPDGAVLYSASANHTAVGTIRVHDLKSDKPPQEWKGHTKGVICLAVSVDGEQLASCGIDERMRIWDTRTGEHKVLADGRGEGVWSVCFSPDGKTLAVGTAGQQDQRPRVKLYDLAARKVREWTAPGVRSLAICPNNKLLGVAYGWEKQDNAELIDLDSGKRRRLAGHEGGTISLTFSPDGRRFITGGFDNQIAIWDTATGDRIDLLKGHTMTVETVACSADGTLLLTTADRFNVPTGAFQKRAYAAAP